jgi:hypothetical protein
LLYHFPKSLIPLVPNQPLYSIADPRIKTSLQQQQSRKGNDDDLQQVWKGEGKKNFKAEGRQRRSGGSAKSEWCI